ncbi:MAG: type II toxin-antitoxin system HicB family antitoxin [Deltaproteobacteria bacterium]|nr:type II toxin-antitoxin system HicB family antitoxin [Deltaproteobacteria bacterium]MCB9490404.1 type II toxin-antitoxin system HicB family antitoxin [Deltaproteobacteria bacterium]
MSDSFEGYWAIFTPDDLGDGRECVAVSFPEFPLTFSMGDDEDDARAMATDALVTAIEDMFEKDVEYPERTRKPRVPAGSKAVFIPLPEYLRVPLRIRQARRERNLTQAQVARRMGIDEKTYRRHERPGIANMTIKTLERISQALGTHLEISLQSPKRPISPRRFTKTSASNRNTSTKPHARPSK